MTKCNIKRGDYVKVIDISKLSYFYDKKERFYNKIFKVNSINDVKRYNTKNYYRVKLIPIKEYSDLNFYYNRSDGIFIYGARLEKLDDEYVMSKII